MNQIILVCILVMYWFLQLLTWKRPDLIHIVAKVSIWTKHSHQINCLLHLIYITCSRLNFELVVHLIIDNHINHWLRDVLSSINICTKLSCQIITPKYRPCNLYLRCKGIWFLLGPLGPQLCLVQRDMVSLGPFGPSTKPDTTVRPFEPPKRTATTVTCLSPLLI